jgi:type IV fimbrial biogenesis protein FimT
VFQPTGGNSGSNATFTLCDGRGAASATALVLSNGGRMRAGRPSAAAARRCVAGGG